MQHHNVLKLTFGLALVALLLLAACSGGRHGAMLAQLEELERQNRADSVMRNDSLARELAEYFDRHGSPNERMRAHYILGRTYADMGEAPAALNSYLDAAVSADTTAADCDFNRLSRVYSQMAGLFYWQNLTEDFLNSIEQSIKYAWLAKDTIQALNSAAHKIGAYERLQQYETGIAEFEGVYALLLQLYGDEIAAKYCLLPVKSLLANKKPERAKMFLDIYRTRSEYVDSLGVIEPGREVYYYYLGQYYLSAGQYDSAMYSFYKELDNASDVLNQNMASHGLSLAYQGMGKHDSAAKYAIYSYDMNDSVYKKMATNDVEQMKAMYDYARHQEEAQEEKEKTLQEKRQKNALVVLVVAVILVVSWVSFTLTKKRRKLEQDYRNKVVELSVASKELEELRSLQKENVGLNSIKEKLTMQIEAKELVVEKLKKELASFKRKERLTMSNSESQLAASVVYQQLQSKANAGKLLSEKEWEEIETLVNDVLPGFFVFMQSSKHELNEVEYRMCILFRLHIDMKGASGFIGVSKTSISRYSSAVLKHLFNETGCGKELKRKMESIT